MVTEAVLGTARGAGRRGCAGRTPMGSGPPHPPPFLYIKRPTGGRAEGGSGEPRLDTVGSSSPAPQFLGGHLPSLHAHSHTRDFPFSLSMDLLTVSGDCAVAPRGARRKGEAFAVQLGRSRGRRGLFSFAAWAHQGLSLRRGRWFG